MVRLVMMAASAGDKCTRVLGSQSGAGRVHCGKLHRKNLGYVDNFVGKRKVKVKAR